MSLSGARGLVRVSKNPECALQAAMVAEGVAEPEFFRRMTGTEYPGEYGERASARRRGSKFEANLHTNDAALLRRSLAPLYGYDPETMRVRNFDDELPGSRQGIRAMRLARTRNILRDLSRGREVPHVLIQPRLQLGRPPDASWHIGPDFMVLDPVARIYVPGEEKSFIVRDGLADRADLELTRRQAAAQVLALRSEASAVGIVDRVTDRAVFVLATPYGLMPAPALAEDIAAEVQAIMRSLIAIDRAEQRLRELRAESGDAALENLADELPINYQESCVGSCILAGVCKARFAGRACQLGNAAGDMLGPDFEVERILMLAAGAEPRAAREAELARQLRDAAAALGLDLTQTRRAAG